MFNKHFEEFEGLYCKGNVDSFFRLFAYFPLDFLLFFYPTLIWIPLIPS